MDRVLKARAILIGLTTKIRASLADPSDLMKQLGALMVSQSGKAFDESRLGEYIWPRRYPNQGEGDRFVNIAGIVSDFSQGKEPPLRRFQARPPLLDTGWLRRTAKDRSKSLRLLNTHEVEVGTTDPKAARHQWGGQSEEFITDTTRENAAAWLRGGPKWSKRVKAGKAAYDVKSDRKTGYMGTLTRRERFGSTLGFLFRSRVLFTRVNQRPFIGIPPELRGKMIATVRGYFGPSAGVRVVK